MYIGAVLCAPTSVTEPASDTARCSRQTACNCSETRVRLHLPTPQTLVEGSAEPSKPLTALAGSLPAAAGRVRRRLYDARCGT